jgi:hypothetical protein
MTRLADEPDILDLARELGGTRTGDPVEAILAVCRDRIDRWVEETGGVRTIAVVQPLERKAPRKVRSQPEISLFE